MKILTYTTALISALAMGQSLCASSTDANGCVIQSLAVYTDGVTCIVNPPTGVLVYSNFSFFATQTGGATLLSASQIPVTPVAGGLGGGFVFGDPSSHDLFFSVGAGQTATYYIDYDFFIDPGPILTAGDLSLDPPIGTISVTQAFCNDGYFTGSTNDGIPVCSTSPVSSGDVASAATNGLFLAQVLRVDNSNFPVSDANHINFSPPAFIRGQIQTTIFLNGGNNGASFGSIASVQSVVSATPEPATWALTVGTLLTLAAWSKRKRQV